MKATRDRSNLLAAVGAVSAVVLTLVSLVSGPASASSGRWVSASTKDWSVTLWVARTPTKAGTTIPATVTVDNRTGHRVEITGRTFTNCEVLVGNAKVPNLPIIPTILCASSMSAGVHVFHTKVQTTYQRCGGEGTAHCGNPPKMSALPVGPTTPSIRFRRLGPLPLR
jgi:hypothetical protein